MFYLQNVNIYFISTIIHNYLANRIPFTEKRVADLKATLLKLIFYFKNNNFNINIIASTTITNEILFFSSDFAKNRLYKIFISTYDITPIVNPSPILYERGIITIVKNAGRPSVISEKSIFLTAPSIKYPTYISAGAVAHDGIDINIGEKNIAIKNKIPAVIAVHPVFPPAATPVELST